MSDLGTLREWQFNAARRLAPEGSAIIKLEPWGFTYYDPDGEFVEYRF